jgi:hypothetical protein
MTEVGAGAMQVFLDRFAAALPGRTHAALLLDGAGWHTAGEIVVPANVSLTFLPPALQPEPQPGRTDLALPARALPLAAPLRRSRRHPRRLLRRLEPPHRRARPHRLPDRLSRSAIGQDFMSQVSRPGARTVGAHTQGDRRLEQIAEERHRSGA